MKAAYHIALNAVRDRRRQERFNKQLQDEPSQAGDCSSEGQCLDQVTPLRLYRALAQLPSKQREAIEFRFYGGLTVQEISLSMGISEGSVKVHLFRALNRLNELLGTFREEK